MNSSHIKSGVLLAFALFSTHSFSEHQINGLAGIKYLRGNAKGLYYVQLASFSNKGNAYRFLHQQKKHWGNRAVIRMCGKYYSVGIGPLQSADEVRALVKAPVIISAKKVNSQPVVKKNGSPKHATSQAFLTTYSITKDAPEKVFPSLSMGISGGYGHINGAYKQDGNTGLARVFLGLQLHQFNTFSLGIETGIQSGNSMRLYTNPVIIEEAGGLPVQASLKPIIDALITVKGRFNTILPLGYRLKGGLAYRQLQFENRNSARDTLNKFNAELQAGLGYSLTPNLALTAMYQGIYAPGSAQIQPDAIGDLLLSHIPGQQAGLLGVEYSF